MRDDFRELFDHCKVMPNDLSYWLDKHWFDQNVEYRDKDTRWGLLHVRFRWKSIDTDDSEDKNLLLEEHRDLNEFDRIESYHNEKPTENQTDEYHEDHCDTEDRDNFEKWSKSNWLKSRSNNEEHEKC